MKVLFVCLRNVFRSPLASILLRSFLQGNRGKSILIDSAGCDEDLIEGLPVFRGAVTELEKYGQFDFSHRSKGLSRQMCAEADLIIVMDKICYYRSLKIAGTENENKIHIFSHYVGLSGNIDDPLTMDQREEVVRQLYDYCSILAEILQSQ